MATIWTLLKKYASQIGLTYNESGKTYNQANITYSGKIKTVWTLQDKS
ncbi:hypothetical protein K9M47_03090 [Candidatus Gracilibacteria bacterium]|nr:hypothetical protein [Candidatus Gracilibacteria bacterium]